MRVTSRTLLITAAVITAFTLLLESHLPLLFLLLVSELGAILCGVGLWVLWKEWGQGRQLRYILAAGGFFILFALRFVVSGIGYWPS